MLTITVSYREGVSQGTDMSYMPDYWFKKDFKPDWFDDDLVREMIEKVDKNTFRRYDKGEGAWNSNYIMYGFIGYVDPSRLSTGVKSLILIHKTERLIKSKSLGDNCIPWLIKLGDIEDITVEFDGIRTIDINSSKTGVKLLETNKVYNNSKDFAYDMLKVAGY